jgi:hypothetical protein
MKRVFDIYTSLVVGFFVFNWLLNGSLFRVGYNIPDNKAVIFFLGDFVIGGVYIYWERKRG